MNCAALIFALALPAAADAPAVNWDGGAARSLRQIMQAAETPAVDGAAPPGLDAPDATSEQRRHWRRITGPGRAPLVESAPLYNPDGTRAKYQPSMSVGVIRDLNVIEWYPVEYGYYVDPYGRLVKGLHVSFDRYRHNYVSVPWGELPLARVDGRYLVPDGLGIPAYAVGDSPQFHPWVGAVPLRRVERTQPQAPTRPSPHRRAPQPGKDRPVQFGW